MSNIKELIRQEIERMLDERALYENLEQRTGGSIALARLHCFLDTLPDEPVTDCHDLEEAKEEYLRKARMTPGHEWMTRDIEDAFKAGAEWGAEHLASVRKMISDDLAEAADDYIGEVVDTAGHPGWDWETHDIIEAFIAGAEWQEKQDLRWAGEIHKNGYNLCKEQMMKGAVEAMVITNLANRPAIYLDQLEGFQYGDKVRMIILPKEGER